MDAVCVGVQIMSRMGHQVSRLVEMHIAFSTLACSYEFTKALRALERGFVFIWPLAALLAVTTVLMCEWFWEPEYNGCNWRKDIGLQVEGFEILVAFAACLGAYAVSSVKTNVVEGVAVQRRVVRRTRLFTISWLLTAFPFVAYTLIRVSDRQQAFRALFFSVTWAILELGGTANFIVYALQNHALRRTAERAAAPVSGGSGVEAEGGDSSRLPEGNVSGNGSLHVSFMDDPQIFTFTPRSSFTEDSPRRPRGQNLDITYTWAEHVEKPLAAYLEDVRASAEVARNDWVKGLVVMSAQEQCLTDVELPTQPHQFPVRVRFQPQAINMLRAMQEAYEPENDGEEDEEAQERRVGAPQEPGSEAAAAAPPPLPAWKVRMNRWKRNHENRTRQIAEYNIREQRRLAALGTTET